MPFRSPLFLVGTLLLLLLGFSGIVFADETAAPLQQTQERTLQPTLLEIAGDRANETVTRALNLIGIRYHRGGTSPETGFDCSGFVGHVFEELGTILPRTAREISKSGETVKKSELQPGDLVFFKTMRHAFSHVGIYLGDNQFIHAPASGGEVRIDDMRLNYWLKRFNGARRIAAE
jgi:cell wall-associated NlpC family hydrolase